MFALLAAFAFGSVALVPLTRILGRRVFLVAALVPTAGFVHALVLLPVVLAAGGGSWVERLPWIPQLGLELSFRLDALSLTLALVVTGVGALVMIYCSRYFGDAEPALGRFAAVLLAFAGAMYGLVVADDIYLLFVFWEATSVFSYLLIAHSSGKASSRRAALQALIVTTFGGLVMLVGLVLVQAATGTSSLSGIVDAVGGMGERSADPLLIVGGLLVVVGIASKSALFPFHFWLPAAMAAPTPVSAYLHAAAMVKAGVYLALRLTPGFADVPGWRESLIVLGIGTMLLGAVQALRQTDLKLVLAHGTVSQLGFLTAVAALGRGDGARDAALAGLALLLGHALFKSTLFLSVGIIDHDHGTRDLRKLSGLGRANPLLAAGATLAVLSMIGIPPLFGFVAKEAAFTAVIEDAAAGDVSAVAILVGLGLGSALTAAYGIRFLWGAFARKPGVEVLTAARTDRLFLAPPLILATAGLLLGPLAGLVDPVLAGYADSAGAPRDPEHVYHLALWHGLEPALAVSVLAIAVGLLVFSWLGRRSSDQATDSLAARAYGATMHGIDGGAARLTAPTQRGSLPFYLGTIFLVVVAAATTTIALSGRPLVLPRLWDSPVQLAIGALMIGAALAATRAEKRFQAVVLVGVTGTGMAALFAVQGAPDLALTQALVETVTLVAVVLVLRRLPARLGAQNGSQHRVIRIVVGVAVGITMAVVAVVAAGARVGVPISVHWAELAVEIGHGKNVVNVALVDLRGWDTMGELSVLIAAATGVASLVFVSGRADTLRRVGRREAAATLRERRAADRAAVDSAASASVATDPGASPEARSSWLLAGRTLADRHRSILLEVVVRLTFHALVVVSVYLLFAGHNAPGGGFAGGLVVGLALVARYLAGGRAELGAAAPFDAGKMLGGGLLIAAGTALVPLFFGADALTSTFFEAEVPVLGHLEFVTSTFFDIGVYLVVIGLVLDVLRSLGAEVDRQFEERSTSSADASTSARDTEAAPR